MSRGTTWAKIRPAPGYMVVLGKVNTIGPTIKAAVSTFSKIKLLDQTEYEMQESEVYPQ